MTLLVGIVCPTGAVIAADRQATHGALGQTTVAQAVTKISILGGAALFATSGPLGLGQQLAHVIESDVAQFATRNYHSYAPLAQRKFRELINPALETAGFAARFLGGAAQADALCGSLLAAQFKDGIKLVEVSPQANFEHLTDAIPFVAMGSGKSNADPFLRYLRYVFFDGSPPNLNEAILAAYWTVRCCIDAGTLGVGLGVDVFVLDGSDPKSIVARRMEEDRELAEASSFIKEAEEAWRAIRDRIRGQGAKASIPPTLPPNGGT